LEADFADTEVGKSIPAGTYRDPPVVNGRAQRRTGTCDQRGNSGLVDRIANL